MRFANWVVTGAVTAVLCGCATAGKDNNLAFHYEADDALFGLDDVKTRVAAGTKVSLVVGSIPAERAEGKLQAHAPSSLEGATIVYAQSSNPDVARVVSFDGESIRVETGVPGVAEVAVRTSEGRADRIDVAVAAIHKIEVAHWTGLLTNDKSLPASVEPTFAAGGVARFLISAWTTTDDRAAPLVGFGDEVPLQVRSGDASIVHRSGDLHHLDIELTRPGLVELETTSGDKLPIRVVEPKDVDSLELVAVVLWKDQPPEKTLKLARAESDEPARYLLLTMATIAGETKLLLGDVATISSASTNVCDIDDDPDHRRVFGDGAVQLEVLQPGQCTVEVTYGDHEASATWSVE